MRGFVAIALPDEIRAALASVQQDLAKSQADVAWVSPANLHVTLKFLDEISDEQARAVTALLQRIAGREASFALSLSGVGAFPSREAPRVVWVGLSEGNEIIARIAEEIEREGAALALPKEMRTFSPHLTIGRVRSPQHRAALVQALATAAWQPPEPWEASSLILYQSVLRADGPRYSVVAEVPLSKR